MSVTNQSIAKRRTLRVPQVQMLEQRWLMSAGDPDLSFAGDGTTVIDLPGSNNEIVNASVIQADGKVITAGRAIVGAETDFFVSRLNANGTVDSTFGGGDGVIMIDFQLNDEAMDVALQADGRIVVVGTSSSGSGSNARKFAVARVSSAGVLDTSFSGDGKVLVDFGINADAQSVAIDGTSIYVGGYKDLGTTGQFALVKLTSAGAEDTSYSADGEVFFGFGGNNDSRCYDIAVDSSHRVMMVGYDEALGGSTARNFAYARVGTNALLDPNFSGDGLAVTDFAGGDDEARAVGIDERGRIVVGGFSPGTGGSDFIATRLSDAGALDSSFNGDGAFRLNLGGVEAVDDLVIYPDNTITLCGQTSVGGFQAALVQINPANGNLNTSFGDGADGIQFIDFGGIDDGFAVAMNPNDLRLVVAGTDGSGHLGIGRVHDLVDQSFQQSQTFSVGLAEYSDGRIIGLDDSGQLVRMLPSGALDSSFGGGDGTVTLPTSVLARDVAVDALDRTIVLTQRDISGGGHEAVVLRYLTDGTLDNTFSGDGLFTFSFTGNPFDGYDALDIDAGNRIVVTGPSETSNGRNFGIARITAAGALDVSFGGDGRVDYNLTGLNGSGSRPSDLVIQPDGRIIIVGNAQASLLGSFDVAVLRLDNDGSKDNSFGLLGEVRINVGGNFEFGDAVALDSLGRILIVGNSVNGVINTDPSIGYIMRLETDGDLDPTFAGAGLVTFAQGPDEAEDQVHVLGDGRIVTIGRVSTNNLSDGSLRIVRRLLSNGQNDPTFSGDGLAIFANGGTAFSGAVMHDAIYVNGDFGTRRINVDPVITDFSFLFDTVPQRLQVRFNDDIGDSLAGTDIVIRNTTTNLTVTTSFYDVTSFDSLTNTATISFANSSGFVLSDGFYTATFSSTGISNRQNMVLQGDRVQDFFFLNADATQDRQVDTLDFNILAGNFGSSGKTFTQGNFSYDAAGQVNSLDFNIFIAHYGKSFPAAAISTASTTAARSIFSAMRVEEDDDMSMLAL